MNSFWAVFKRELKSYFATPLAYVFLVVFLVVAGYLPFKNGFYEARQADLRLFFVNLPMLFAFMASVVAMRLWAEERKVGSVELLFTLPVTITQAVLGKFLAAWLFLGIALLLTFPMVVIVCYLGDPDMGLILTGYLGAFLVAGGFLSIGCFFSAVTKSQVIASVLSLLTCAIILLIGRPSTLNFLSKTGSGFFFLPGAIVPAAGIAYVILLILAWITMGELALLGALWFPVSWRGTEDVVGVLEAMSLQIHFDSMQKGVLQFGDVAYFAILIAGWITACAIILNERKAS